MALDELKLYSVPSAGEVLLYPVYVAPVELGVVFLYSSETAGVVTLHSLIAAESAGGGTPQTVLVGVATETDTASAITPVAGGVSVAVGVALETDAALAITPVAGGVVVVLGVALETDTARTITPYIPATVSPLASPGPFMRPVEYHGMHAILPHPQHHAMVWNMGKPSKTIIVK